LGKLVTNQGKNSHKTLKTAHKTLNLGKHAKNQLEYQKIRTKRSKQNRRHIAKRQISLFELTSHQRLKTIIKLVERRQQAINLISFDQLGQVRVFV
jgi:hypothetical protein